VENNIRFSEEVEKYLTNDGYKVEVKGGRVFVSPPPYWYEKNEDGSYSIVKGNIPRFLESCMFDKINDEIKILNEK
jgi:hypothetical protein